MIKKRRKDNPSITLHGNNLIFLFPSEKRRSNQTENTLTQKRSKVVAQMPAYCIYERIPKNGWLQRWN